MCGLIPIAVTAQHAERFAALLDALRLAVEDAVRAELYARLARALRARAAVVGLAEAEAALTAWRLISGQRDDLVRAAVAAGISKHRVHVLTGVARTTIDRILDSAEEGTNG
jgi:hypothetical protein